jgi:hypothetical protein
MEINNRFVSKPITKIVTTGDDKIILMIASLFTIIALMTAITITPLTYAIQDLPYAVPCKGGTGGEYCSGYHAGAIQADKDDNANRNLDVFQHRCTATTQQYCQGFMNGYNDETGLLK